MQPLAEPVNRGKREIRRRPALPANQFRAAPHIVHHPRRQPRMIRIAPHFADMTCQCRDKIANIFNA